MLSSFLLSDTQVGCKELVYSENNSLNYKDIGKSRLRNGSQAGNSLNQILLAGLKETYKNT